MDTKFKKGDIVRTREGDVIITDIAIVEYTNAVVYKGVRLQFIGPIIISENDAMFKVEKEEDMGFHSVIKS